jgi:hypothetical protein
MGNNREARRARIIVDFRDAPVFLHSTLSKNSGQPCAGDLVKAGDEFRVQPILQQRREFCRDRLYLLCRGFEVLDEGEEDVDVDGFGDEG